MKHARSLAVSGSASVLLCAAAPLPAQDSAALTDGDLRATISASNQGGLRHYTLTSNAPLRDNQPADHRVEFAEPSAHARVRTGNLLFDGLYALAVHEAEQNSVAQIQDGSYASGTPLDLPAFQTGALWKYVWTRDLAYSVHLALANFDPARAESSLFFKTSPLKASITGGYPQQIVQDTGSGGSYPISTDRVVWVLGAHELWKYLVSAEQARFLQRAYPIIRDTLEHDRRVVFDPTDGLYRGEQSFLDWREQTYPLRTKDNVLPIGISKALSVNVLQYFALRTAGEFAGKLGRAEEARRYAGWAAALHRAINEHFWDGEAGLYSTYLIADEGLPVRAHRYDLLGESLAILTGVASESQARVILRHYPTGSYGPPVVWPQERDVPIYHNHAIWPFVTAYWVRAARQTGDAEALSQGIRSLLRGAAFNLSNMENLDVVTGQAEVNTGLLRGPVVNSSRQVWSVAGYLSMVQDAVFGLETSEDGLRFRPALPAQVRNSLFATTDALELRNFRYRGTTLDVRVHLPQREAGQNLAQGFYRIVRTELNGRAIGMGFVPAASLKAHNTWEVFLAVPEEHSPAHTLRMVTDESALFAPLQPEWETVGQGGITRENSLLTLHYRHPDATNVTFNIYRDGKLCAARFTSLTWTDPRSGDASDTTHFYTIEAVDTRNGNASHLAPTRAYVVQPETVLPATRMTNQGGNLVAGHHFENWGQPLHELRTEMFTVPRDGRYLLRAEFSNGAGPINTGITCAVKRLDVLQDGVSAPVASGYLVMPQSGDWTRFDLSSNVAAQLKAGRRYTLRLSEDAYARNMSYWQHNARYTGGAGGGESVYNYVNIASLRLLRISV